MTQISASMSVNPGRNLSARPYSVNDTGSAWVFTRYLTRHGDMNDGPFEGGMNQK